MMMMAIGVEMVPHIWANRVLKGVPGKISPGTPGQFPHRTPEHPEGIHSGVPE